jgi:2-haloacid dehalogenase
LGNPDKKEVLIIGDSLTSDIQGGVNFGIDTCWFNSQRKPNETAMKITYEIYSLNELMHILNNQA